MAGRPLEPVGEALADKFLGVDAGLSRARFLILPLPYERTTCHKKGAGRGPARFIEGSLGLELYDENLGRQTYKAGLHTLPSFACGEGEPAAAYLGRLKRRAAELARLENKILFAVGGEHALSQALIGAYRGLHPDLSVLHFDAHADLRPEYEGTPHSHACALYPASRACRVVQVGVRSVAEEEAHLVNEGNVRTFLMQEHRDIRRLIGKVLRELTNTVYLTIDLDGFDPSVLPGVGTPQPGGFGWYEALDIFRAVIENKRVVGVDIMELCPLRDTVHSELAAAKLAYRLMGYLLHKLEHKITS